MRLSTKGRYAVMAMADLARRGETGAVTLGEIAARQDISLAYLEQLFSRLRRRGLVKSVRGPGGGPAGCMPGGERCLTHDLWDDLGRHIQDYLASVSLDDVISGRLARRRAPEAA